MKYNIYLSPVKDLLNDNVYKLIPRPDHNNLLCLWLTEFLYVDSMNIIGETCRSVNSIYLTRHEALDPFEEFYKSMKKNKGLIDYDQLWS